MGSGKVTRLYVIPFFPFFVVASSFHFLFSVVVVVAVVGNIVCALVAVSFFPSLGSVNVNVLVTLMPNSIFLSF